MNTLVRFLLKLFGISYFFTSFRVYKQNLQGRLSVNVTTNGTKKFIPQVIRELFLPNKRTLRYLRMPGNKTSHSSGWVDKCFDEDDAVSRNYTLQEILNIVASLHPTYKSIYEMYMAGITPKEISDMVQMPEKKIARLIRQVEILWRNSLSR